jgi:hypothetical protein
MIRRADAFSGDTTPDAAAKQMEVLHKIDIQPLQG